MSDKFIGSQYILEDTTTLIKKDPQYLLEFFAYERVATPDLDFRELLALYEQLLKKTDVDKYRGSHGVRYDTPTERGYTVLEVLPQLVGVRLCNLVMAYVTALRPSTVRITRGEVTTDAWPWRVTIFVDENDVVTKIEQEVNVAYSCGSDIDECLRAVKEKRWPKPMSACVGHTAGLERADFQ